MKKKGISISVFMVFLIGLASGGYWYKQQYNKLLESASKGLALGQNYGKMINQSSCMMGIRMKYASCETTECELSANGYITGCMREAKKDQFCVDLPSVNETKKSLAWVKRTCSDNKFGGSKCSKYMHKFVSLCTEQVQNRKRTVMDNFKEGFKKGIEEKKASS